MNAGEQKPILHLNLHKKWFDIIGNPKTEEYRTISNHWVQILGSGHIRVRGKYYHPTDVIICFSNGYSKTRPQKFFEILNLKVGFGRSDWGADENVQYYILTLGKEIKS
jgi:hypothetical protein